MIRYEILILTIPEITKDEASTLEFQVDKLINQVKGSLISFERWGKYRLAYPVRKNDYGVYFLVRFEIEDKHSILKELNSLFAVKFSDIVMRNFVAKLAPDQSLEYQKPPSLEDTPKRHISSFLEEKGLLKRSRPASRHASDSTSKPAPSLQSTDDSGKSDAVVKDSSEKAKPVEKKEVVDQPEKPVVEPKQSEKPADTSKEA